METKSKPVKVAYVRCWCGRNAQFFTSETGEQIGLCVQCREILMDNERWEKVFGEGLCLDQVA